MCLFAPDERGWHSTVKLADHLVFVFGGFKYRYVYLFLCGVFCVLCVCKLAFLSSSIMSLAIALSILDSHLDAHLFCVP